MTEKGKFRDRTLIVLLLHTGLVAREVCKLQCDQIKLGKRSGFLEIIGKRSKYREVPLNATARRILEEYPSTLPHYTVFLFPSGKTKQALSEHALGYIVKKYATAARQVDVSLHDLRHHFGFWMAESVTLHRLAQILGHDSLDTTKLHIQVMKQDTQEAVETIA
jgi:integrase/recombinase XerD